MEIFVDALLDALKDTAIVIPILYLAYLLVGYFSHNSSKKYSKILHHTKKAGPLVGAFLGCVPQCGFSSVMAQLYSNKVVTLGTLFAVFIATSDEAIPLMIAKPEYIPKLLFLLLFKVIFAILIGYGVDLTMRIFVKKSTNKAQISSKIDKINEEDRGGHALENADKTTEDKVCLEDKVKECSEGKHELTEHIEEQHCEHCEGHEHMHNHEHEEEFMACGCGHKHTHSDCCAKNIFLDALKHTAIIMAYVFVATLIINICIGYCGLDSIRGLFTDNVFVQITLACLVGLIPNCAASVFLVELYMSGVIMFAPLLAGLCTGAGVGIIVLFTTNKKKIWQNLLIVLLLYVFAFICGLITSFIPIV